jgi:hypothetical protein
MPPGPALSLTAQLSGRFQRKNKKKKNKKRIKKGTPELELKYIFFDLILM